MSTPIDLTPLSAKELMRLEASILLELKRRELVRTNNRPIGDIAEYVVWLARGGVLEPNSTKSHDVTTATGQRVQVKAMGTRSVAGGKFSPFRSTDFDAAVFLVFDSAFDLAEAWEVEAARIEEVTLSAHVRGQQPTLNQVRAFGTSVTAEMQAAYARIDG